jgi:nicotinamide-nucleotide amidase
VPSVEIVTVGTEILLGQLIDTNAAHIARALADAGVDVFAKHSVGDNTERLAAMLEGALARADGVVTTGGLGPTVDDLTRDAVARVAGLPLELHEPSLEAIEARFAALGRTMTENNRYQAMLPQGATAFANPHGTAPGFVAVRGDGKFIACMPGVPREMKPMLAESLIPWLRARYALRGGIFTRTLHTVGIPESELDRRIEDLFRALENPKIAMLAHEGRVDVKIMAKAPDASAARELIAPVEAGVRERIGSGIFGVDEETLEGAIVRELGARGTTLGTAESITGGGLADAIVRVPGASAVFRGGIVAYDNAVKAALLGVEAALLAAHGAVSAEVAQAMAEGARVRLGVDIAIATTGIAGPSGGSAEKPVGLVYFGLAAPEETVVRRLTFPGTRADVRQRAVTTALNLLWRYLERAEPAASRATFR